MDCVAEPRVSPGRPSSMISGVAPGSTAHLILLALRGVGGMSSDQVYARFNGSTSAALYRLKSDGLIVMPANGHKGKPINLTDLGRDLTSSDGPLSRRKTLNTYCQL